MKILLSILVLLVFAFQSEAGEDIDKKRKIDGISIFDSGIQNSVYLKTALCDEQDLNDFNGPYLFFENAAPDIHSPIYKVKNVPVFLSLFFTDSFQYLLIDLPPPSFSQV
ncbi:hypothetical protein [Maribellus maritimus]|uniref:hypothetical protein n=1 Tax=Maribellus maritimus TaxID=2870838 RepID=UPI001EECD2B5|nr:hypothetical protein [Maribellus maritimus]MCG6191321.1 hypothetical protein [Maribellus maritimus]